MARSSWTVLWVAFAAGVVGTVVQFSIPPILPVFQNQYQVSHATAGLLMSLFALTTLLAAVPSGFIVRRYGVRAIGLLGLGILFAGVICCYTAKAFSVLLAGRIIQGVGFGLVSVAAPSAIGQFIAPQMMSVAMGIWSTWVPLGSVLMFLFAPFFVTRFRVDAFWLILMGVLGMAFVLYAVLIPRSPAAKNEQEAGVPKPTGTSSARLAREGGAGGAQVTRELGAPDARLTPEGSTDGARRTPTLGGVEGGPSVPGESAGDRRAGPAERVAAGEDTLIPPKEAIKRELKNSHVWWAAGAFASFTFAFFAFNTWIATHLTATQSMSLVAASSIPMVVSLFMIGSNVYAGLLLRRLGNRLFLFILPPLAMAVLWPLFLSGSTGALYIGAALLGAIGGFVPTIVFASAPLMAKMKETVGIAMSIVIIGENAGILIGPEVFGVVRDYTGDFAIGFWMLVAVALFTAAACCRIWKSKTFEIAKNGAAKGLRRASRICLTTSLIRSTIKSMC